MLRNKAELSLVTDPEEREGVGVLTGAEVLQNKAEMLQVTDPEGWE